MAVLRVNKTSNYTVMSNYHFKEKEMSLKAKGLLSLMLSLPDTWDYSINGLVAICRENETAINSTLKELKEFGYLSITKTRNDRGYFEYTYDIYESPNRDNPQVKQPGVENLGVDNPGMENQGQLNNNLLIIKELNKKKINTNNPEVLTNLEIMFNQFWQTYPKKINKQGTFKAFKKIANLQTEFPLILEAIEYFKTTKGWQKDKGQFIPHPTTFINQERWKDEREETRDEKLQTIDMTGWV